MQHLRITAFILAAVSICISSTAFAEPPAHAKNGKGNLQAEHVQKSNHDNQIAHADNQIHNCPRGLAKKAPVCIPPGQAKKWAVGDSINRDNVHFVTQPGHYGLSTPPKGARYAIIDGQLVRVDSESGQILSILRVVDAILD